ncbi:class I SAM-dependent methyltransferase [Gracilimonas sp.]|uniref:class I SAM-dependent methyltransferase n=1 Tax=Gracilimonas sp. TaxID=1974203 RepID=UPI0028728C14|nr:methyltransferase domain-containing protein [Gracilimonas sp.]
MTDIELLIDFHKEADRQGPGSSEETLKALRFIQSKKNKPIKIADIGCGTGAQTITLAENIEGEITAVDLFPEFLEKLEAKLKELELDHKIKTLKADMANLPLQENEFDVIWSEGAIYFMGFEEGIKQWKKFLKPGGYLAVSEITWLTESKPKEIEDHWNKEYPEIDTASNKIKQLEKDGYSPLAYFAIPESCWIENYYQPMQARFNAFLDKHNHSEMAKNLVEMEKAEIRMYKKYKKYISCGFYIAKKV